MSIEAVLQPRFYSAECYVSFDAEVKFRYNHIKICSKVDENYRIFAKCMKCTPFFLPFFHEKFSKNSPKHFDESLILFLTLERSKDVQTLQISINAEE